MNYKTTFDKDIDIVAIVYMFLAKIIFLPQVDERKQ